MTNVYTDLGVRPIVNATGVFTRLGGALMPPEVTSAMAAAIRVVVILFSARVGVGVILLVGYGHTLPIGKPGDDRRVRRHVRQGLGPSCRFGVLPPQIGRE